jgi:hypothetical protein
MSGEVNEYFLTEEPERVPWGGRTSRTVRETTSAEYATCGPLYIDPVIHADCNRRCVVTVTTVTETVYLRETEEN